MRRHAATSLGVLKPEFSQVRVLFCIVENERMSSKKLAEIFEVKRQI
jgi:hypothetical protein